MLCLLYCLLFSPTKPIQVVSVTFNRGFRSFHKRDKPVCSAHWSFHNTLSALVFASKYFILDLHSSPIKGYFFIPSKIAQKAHCVWPPFSTLCRGIFEEKQASVLRFNSRSLGTGLPFIYFLENRVFDDKFDIFCRSQNPRRNYIPSPLTTPRRMTRKLGDQITNSPIFRRKMIPSAPPSAQPSPAEANTIPSISRTSSENKSGLLAFLSSAFKRGNGRKNFDGKNMFLDPRMHDDYEDSMEMHQFSDSGRIANRYDNMRWDVW